MFLQSSGANAASAAFAAPRSVSADTSANRSRAWFGLRSSASSHAAATETNAWTTAADPFDDPGSAFGCFVVSARMKRASEAASAASASAARSAKPSAAVGSRGSPPATTSRAAR